MTNVRGKSEVLKKYLKRLGNPYASLQVNDVAETQIGIEATSSANHPHVRHPYAYLSASDDENGASHDVADRLTPKVVTGTLSKADFRQRCRRIFGQYIPDLEKGRLRKHHQDFITRNESSSPAARYLLVNELQKYDLSNVSGLKAHFNRERDALTEDKLKKIESLVDRESK